MSAQRQAGETLSAYQDKAREIALRVLSKNLARDWANVETRLDVRAQMRRELALAEPSTLRSAVCDLTLHTYDNGDLRAFTVSLHATPALHWRGEITRFQIVNQGAA